MNEVSEIILHVGLHKTGTSSIQETLFLNENNKILKNHGFLYPKNWVPNHSIPVYSAFCDNPEKYHANIKLGYNLSEIEEINKNYLIKLEKEIKENKLSKLIISGEDISLLSIKNLYALKEYLKSISKSKIKIIFHVRNSLSLSISTIQEKIKSGEVYKSAFLKVNDKIKNIFKNDISKFSQVFGEKSINIFSFEDVIKHEFGPVGHFLSIVGFENEIIKEFNIVRSNESISLIGGDMLSFINERASMFVDGKLNKNRTNGDFLFFLKINGIKYDISYNDKLKLLENSQEDVKWLKENWGIDYSNITIEQKELYYEFTEKIINDIKEIYPELSITLKGLLIEYLENKLATNPNLLKLLNGFKILYQEDLKISIDDIKSKFTIYKLNNKPIEVSQHVKVLEKKFDFWYIESSGNDPHFIIPEFNEIDGEIYIKIEITASTNAGLQLFYISDNNNFDINHCLTREIQKGYNEIILKLQEKEPIKSLRLDPANAEGIYLLHSFEVRK